MPELFADIEPHYGWLGFYDPELDERSPFALERDPEAEPSQRALYTFEAHPRWDSIGSESLLVKLLFVRYEEGYAVIELFGEWNDLYENDWRLLCENCLDWLVTQGISRFVLICENVFHIYLESDDYYQAFDETLSEATADQGWVCLLRARPEVLTELERYRISPYFYWNRQFDDLRWRKLKPWELVQLVQASMDRLLGPASADLLPHARGERSAD